MMPGGRGRRTMVAKVPTRPALPRGMSFPPPRKRGRKQVLSVTPSSESISSTLSAKAMASPGVDGASIHSFEERWREAAPSVSLGVLPVSVAEVRSDKLRLGEPAAASSAVPSASDAPPPGMRRRRRSKRTLPSFTSIASASSAATPTSGDSSHVILLSMTTSGSSMPPELAQRLAELMAHEAVLRESQRESAVKVEATRDVEQRLSELLGCCYMLMQTRERRPLLMTSLQACKGGCVVENETRAPHAVAGVVGELDADDLDEEKSADALDPPSSASELAAAVEAEATYTSSSHTHAASSIFSAKSSLPSRWPTLRLDKGSQAVAAPIGKLPHCCIRKQYMYLAVLQRQNAVLRALTPSAHEYEEEQLTQQRLLGASRLLKELMAVGRPPLLAELLEMNEAELQTRSELEKHVMSMRDKKESLAKAHQHHSLLQGASSLLERLPAEPCSEARKQVASLLSASSAALHRLRGADVLERQLQQELAAVEGRTALLEQLLLDLQAVDGGHKADKRRADGGSGGSGSGTGGEEGGDELKAAGMATLRFVERQLDAQLCDSDASLCALQLAHAHVEDARHNRNALTGQLAQLMSLHNKRSISVELAMLQSRLRSDRLVRRVGKQQAALLQRRETEMELAMASGVRAALAGEKCDADEFVRLRGRLAWEPAASVAYRAVRALRSTAEGGVQLLCNAEALPGELAESGAAILPVWRRLMAAVADRVSTAGRQAEILRQLSFRVARMHGLRRGAAMLEATPAHGLPALGRHWKLQEAELEAQLAGSTASLDSLDGLLADCYREQGCQIVLALLSEAASVGDAVRLSKALLAETMTTQPVVAQVLQLPEETSDGSAATGSASSGSSGSGGAVGGSGGAEPGSEPGSASTSAEIVRPPLWAASKSSSGSSKSAGGSGGTSALLAAVAMAVGGDGDGAAGSAGDAAGEEEAADGSHLSPTTAGEAVADVIGGDFEGEVLSAALRAQLERLRLFALAQQLWLVEHMTFVAMDSGDAARQAAADADDEWNAAAGALEYLAVLPPAQSRDSLEKRHASLQLQLRAEEMTLQAAVERCSMEKQLKHMAAQVEGALALLLRERALPWAASSAMQRQRFRLEAKRSLLAEELAARAGSQEAHQRSVVRVSSLRGALSVLDALIAVEDSERQPLAAQLVCKHRSRLSKLKAQHAVLQDAAAAADLLDARRARLLGGQAVVTALQLESDDIELELNVVSKNAELARLLAMLGSMYEQFARTNWLRLQADRIASVISSLRTMAKLRPSAEQVKEQRAAARSQLVAIMPVLDACRHAYSRNDRARLQRMQLEAVLRFLPDSVDGEQRAIWQRALLEAEREEKAVLSELEVGFIAPLSDLELQMSTMLALAEWALYTSVTVSTDDRGLATAAAAAASSAGPAPAAAAVPLADEPTAESPSQLYLSCCRHLAVAPNSALLSAFSGDAVHATRFSLARNFVGDRGAQAALAAIACNSRLTSLDLAGNGLRAPAVQLLATTFAAHPSLAELDLSFNRIGSAGGRALLALIDSCRSLRHVRVHGCKLPDALLLSIEEALQAKGSSLLPAL
eukprot:PLAT7576.1.p1 GENE.PLAT7576.1~~PLAT7576.1.p1  ORF type:complete len:1564 (-),score=771.86 PLAT7576.1:244-4935(-)